MEPYAEAGLEGRQKGGRHVLVEEGHAVRLPLEKGPTLLVALRKPGDTSQVRGTTGALAEQLGRWTACKRRALPRGVLRRNPARPPFAYAG